MSLKKKPGVIWLDGKFVPWEQANIHVLSHTLHYGLGVFEGVRAYACAQGSAIFRLQEHTDRLLRSARILDFSVPYTQGQLNAAQIELMQVNKLQSAYIRPTIFYGAEHLNIHPLNAPIHVAIAAWEWKQYFKRDHVDTGIKVHVSSYNRHHSGSSVLKAKANGNYMHSGLALQEAKALGCEEALLLDSQGFIAEGSSSNVFIVKKGILYTPTTAAILEGITRETVIQLAKDHGLQVIEKNLTRGDVYTADEMFFTGTASEITPASEVDRRLLGSGKIGEITAMMQESYQKATKGSKEEAYANWRTYI